MDIYSKSIVFQPDKTHSEEGSWSHRSCILTVQTEQTQDNWGIHKVIRFLKNNRAEMEDQSEGCMESSSLIN